MGGKGARLWSAHTDRCTQDSACVLGVCNRSVLDEADLLLTDRVHHCCCFLGGHVAIPPLLVSGARSCDLSCVGALWCRWLSGMQECIYGLLPVLAAG